MNKTEAIIIMVLILVCLYGCAKTESLNNENTSLQSPSPSVAMATESKSDTFAPNVTPDVIQNTDGVGESSPVITPKEEGVKSSKNDLDYLDDMSVFPLSMDFNGDDIKDELSVELIINTKDDYNHTTGIKLIIDGHEAILEDVWNDGFGLKTIDLDTDDTLKDICVFAYGTDVSVNVFIFRYDGEKINLYSRFHVGDDVSFSYNEKGMVYYNTFLDEPDDFRYVHVTYYYRDNVESYIDI